MTMIDHETELFERALDEARHRDCAASVDGATRFGLGSTMRAMIEFGPADGGGGEARWSLALNWASDPDERLPPLTPIRRGEVRGLREDDQESIASELGLSASLTEDQLARRWRAFVWRNHPDRQLPGARERATARVAIANTLYDQARRQLAKGR